ncbi:MAG: SBBP repeat-containing protein, partial [Anaerolineales bacterium]|nr:SBBP repeat-containing protein [Anaerolineales bacterium]
FLFLLLSVVVKAFDEGLAYSTLLGGELADEAVAAAVDENGRFYITGRTQSTMFPAGQATSWCQNGTRTNANERGLGQWCAASHGISHGIDVYVARLSADGSALDYLFWFYATNASDIDEAFDMAVDAEGAAYVVGHTRSADFCTIFGTAPGYDTSYNDNGDAFLLKVRPDGSGLEFCTFLGGTDWDLATAVSLSPSGQIYVTGGTWSTDFPVSDGSQHHGLRDLFVATFDSSGTQLEQATLVGGSGQEESRGLVLDEAGRLYVTGWTNSADFPTKSNSYNPEYGGNFDAFVLQLMPDLSLGYGTYVGGSSEDRPTGLEVAADGTATVVGYTRSADFPVTTTAVYQGGSDIFLVQLAPDGTTLPFAMLAGGEGDDWANGVAAENDRFWLTGETWSAGWVEETAVAGYDRTANGSADGFLLQISPDNPQPITYASYLGGSAEDRGGAVAIAHNHAFLAGDTRSADFPLTAGSFSQTPSGDYDIYLTKLPLPAGERVYYLFLPVVR